MTFFDSHDAESFGAVSHRIEIRPDRKQRADQRVPLCGRNAHLIGELTRERQTTQPCRMPVPTKLARRHVGQRVVCEIDVGQQPCQQRARLRTCNRKRRPLFCDGCRLHIKLRPQHLPRVIDVLHNLCSIQRCRREVEPVIGKARRCPVVHYESIFAQHHAIACLADGKCGKRVDVKTIEKMSGVGTVDVDLAERRYIADADAVSRHRHLAVDDLQPIRFARPREPLRTFP